MVVTGDADRRESDLPEEVIADLLASERRRAILVHLADSEGSVTVGDLATAALAASEGVPTEAVGDTKRRDARLELLETHLPKLVATGVVEYDSLRDRVELADPAVALRAGGRDSRDRS